jgi:hypothetical protein
MGLKGHRLLVTGQLDSTCTAPPGTDPGAGAGAGAADGVGAMMVFEVSSSTTRNAAM